MKRKKRKQYSTRYQSENYKIIALHFHKEKDSKVLERLNNERNKTNYVRRLVLHDIKEPLQGKKLDEIT